MAQILEKILARKREEVEAFKQETPLFELKARIANMGPTRDFVGTLKRRAEVGTAIIAEVKKGSPSKGIIREDFHPVTIARGYERAGAACLSVLTDRDFFYGDIQYLQDISKAVSLPLLRKDFIIDAYQILKARVYGADAILLITAALEDEQLLTFCSLAHTLKMGVLLEVHDEAELERALHTDAELIGINNRNLNSFETDIAVTERLLPMIPKDRLVVSESGIHRREEIERLKGAGAGAFLIGESLMREADFEAKLKTFL